MEDRVKRDATLDVTRSVSVFDVVFFVTQRGPAGDSFLVLFLESDGLRAALRSSGTAAGSLVTLSLELDRVLGLWIASRGCSRSLDTGDAAPFGSCPTMSLPFLRHSGTLLGDCVDGDFERGRRARGDTGREMDDLKRDAVEAFGDSAPVLLLVISLLVDAGDWGLDSAPWEMGES